MVKTIRQIFTVGVAAATLLCAANINPERYLNHVKFLASPDMKGRGSGTPELEKAAGYIVKQFKQDGLKPVNGQGYEQAFSVTVNAKMGGKNRLEWSAGGHNHALKPQQDFGPFNFSSSGAA